MTSMMTKCNCSTCCLRWCSCCCSQWCCQNQCWNLLRCRRQPQPISRRRTSWYQKTRRRRCLMSVTLQCSWSTCCLRWCSCCCLQWWGQKQCWNLLCCTNTRQSQRKSRRRTRWNHGRKRERRMRSLMPTMTPCSCLTCCLRWCSCCCSQWWGQKQCWNLLRCTCPRQPQRIFRRRTR